MIKKYWKMVRMRFGDFFSCNPWTALYSHVNHRTASDSSEPSLPSEHIWNQRCKIVKSWPSDVLGLCPRPCDDFLGLDMNFGFWPRMCSGSIIIPGQIIAYPRARGNSRILVQPHIGFLGHDCLRPTLMLHLIFSAKICWIFQFQL